MIDFKKISDFILSFIFTKRCRYCNNLCNITDEICEKCADSIPSIDGEICFNCGIEKALCKKCEHKHFYESVCAPYYYEGAPKHSVIHLKYVATPRIVDSLSYDMVSCVKKHYENLDFDFCTYVPMHIDNVNERGFNQSKLLAERVSAELNIPCYELLIKDFKTSSQHRLPQIMRSGNVLGAISFNQASSVNIAGSRILLCDDIKTTGSTLDECAKVLLFEGCAEVRCVTACIGKKEKTESL